MTYALGLAGGLGVNTLSNDVGYRGAATAAAIAAILISTNWLRQLPARTPAATADSWTPTPRSQPWVRTSTSG